MTPLELAGYIATWVLLGMAAGWVLGYLHGQLTAYPRKPFTWPRRCR